MSVIRLMLLVAVLGALALLLLQNWSPALSLVFLGMRSQQLPLAMWILFSSAAGAVTSLAIASLLNLSSFFAGQKQRTPLKSPPNYKNATANRTSSQETTSRKQPSPSTTREEQPRTNEAFDDWDTDSSSNDDWDFDENTSTQNSRNTQFQGSKTYERQQEPTTSSQSGSVYSYSYQQPKNSGVGKTESVYDADYRVIVPPHQPSTPKRADDDDDDWGFFDDDNFENEKKDKDKEIHHYYE
ncbi:LapA family protein [Aetokthonos hydrillicola]|uniref:LapA family protein n=1 Tax=Aetokthonos hydrillicola TaxID=1550245 RepID=UPI001ABA41AC|nr:LapA family protein [Aetokthonos hydrillicola]MBO3464326.1 LapA family protein [Aetokthonos hydrillicola CCALA 1050]